MANDLLYIFLVVILGTIAWNVGLAVLEPSMIGEPADPFATPLEILPKWYFFGYTQSNVRGGEPILLMADQAPTGMNFNVAYVETRH